MLPIERMCRIMDVSPRGYRAYRSRPLNWNQRTDMVVLAHIREQFAQSQESYGCPRMTEKPTQNLRKLAPNRTRLWKTIHSDIGTL